VDLHSNCGSFCRMPLHPGPCKGWRGTLRRIASIRPGRPAPTPKRRTTIHTPTPPSVHVRDLAAADGPPSPARNTARRQMRKHIDQAYKMHDPVTGLSSRVAAVGYNWETNEQLRRAGYGRNTAPLGSVEIALELLDRNGAKVGDATRSWTIGPDGKLTVKHDYLSLPTNVQGGGFARKLDDQAEQLYRAAGVKWIDADVNMTVGGYASAKKGYHFADYPALEHLATQVRRVRLRDPANRATMAALLTRVTPQHWAVGTAPTPLEFAMAGYTPGSAQWFGKKMMLGRDWRGRKPVTVSLEEAQGRPGALAAAAAAATVTSAADLVHRADVMHKVWTEAVASQVPANPPDDPGQHSGGPSNYAEHHHDISADGPQQAAYETAVATLIRQWQTSIEGAAA